MNDTLVYLALEAAARYAGPDEVRELAQLALDGAGCVRSRCQGDWEVRLDRKDGTWDVTLSNEHGYVDSRVCSTYLHACTEFDRMWQDYLTGDYQHG